MTRCSSVIALLARPLNHAPTMYAAPVSNPYTTCKRLSARVLHRSASATYTREWHQIVVDLEITGANHGPASNNSQANDHNGHPQ